MPAAAVAARFDVGLAWVYRVLQRRRVAAALAALVPLLIVNSFSKASPKSKDWRTAVITSAFVVAFMLIAGADAPPSIPRTALLVSTTCMIACHHLGEFREAADHADAVLTLAPCAPHPERCISVLDPVVASLTESARNLLITGRLSE